MMLQHFRWGSVFLLAGPVMALLLVAGPLLLPEYRDPFARSLDPSSTVLSLLAVLSVIYGLKLFAQDGFGWLPSASMVGGLALGFGFVRRQRKLEDPLIDLRLFRAPAFSASLATYLLVTFVAFGAYVFIGQYLQLVLQLTPLSAGLWLLPWSGGLIVGSTLAPALERRTSPVAVMAASLALSALGLCVLTRLVELGLAGLVIGTILFALGLAPVVTLGTDLVVGAAPPEAAGAAAAISETGSELGGALGIAILGSLGTAVYRAAMARATLEGIPPEARSLARDTLGGAVAAAASLSDPAALALLDAARAAFAEALQVTVAVCAVICGLGAILVVVLLRRVTLHPLRPQASRPRTSPRERRSTETATSKLEEQHAQAMPRDDVLRAVRCTQRLGPEGGQ
jgi:DHA2 family multidrug resistance protein-like MFS transporter